MKVRYKTGKFTSPVAVTPGDVFSCTLTEERLDDEGWVVTKTQQVSEEITKAMTISHWVMFYIPGCPSLGGMFGTQETIDNIPNIFVDAEEVPPGESLMG